MAYSDSDDELRCAAAIWSNQYCCLAVSGFGMGPPICRKHYIKSCVLLVVDVVGAALTS